MFHEQNLQKPLGSACKILMFYKQNPDFFNSYVSEWGVGRSALDYDERLYSQDLLKWEIIFQVML